jgi:hypothetical protein
MQMPTTSQVEEITEVKAIIKASRDTKDIINHHQIIMASNKGGDSTKDSILLVIKNRHPLNMRVREKRKKEIIIVEVKVRVNTSLRKKLASLDKSNMNARINTQFSR